MCIRDSNYTAHTVTWTLGPANPNDVNCSGPGPCGSTAYYPTPRLNLRFPADVFTTAGEVLVNSATAKAQRWEPAEVLKALFAEEVAGRERSALATRRAAAGFPTGRCV